MVGVFSRSKFLGQKRGGEGGGGLLCDPQCELRLLIAGGKDKAGAKEIGGGVIYLFFPNTSGSDILALPCTSCAFGKTVQSIPPC